MNSTKLTVIILINNLFDALNTFPYQYTQVWFTYFKNQIKTVKVKILHNKFLKSKWKKNNKTKTTPNFVVYMYIHYNVLFLGKT